MRSFDRYLDVIETAVKNIDPITASGFKEALYHNLQDAIFGLAYDSEVLNRLRELDQPAQNLLEAVTPFARSDMARRKAELLSALEGLRKAMKNTALCIGDRQLD